VHERRVDEVSVGDVVRLIVEHSDGGRPNHANVVQHLPVREQHGELATRVEHRRDVRDPMQRRAGFELHQIAASKGTTGRSRTGGSWRSRSPTGALSNVVTSCVEGEPERELRELVRRPREWLPVHRGHDDDALVAVPGGHEEERDVDVPAALEHEVRVLAEVDACLGRVAEVRRSSSRLSVRDGSPASGVRRSSSHA